MMVKCPDCGRTYDDAARWTICPHNNLAVGHDTAYCAKHDLYNCPFCTGSGSDALGVTKPMRDEIVGKSILCHPLGAGDVGTLYFVARRPSGEVFCNFVPIVADIDYDRVKKEWQRPLWKYHIEGGKLHGEPSINDQGQRWHNTFNWSVEFVEWDPEKMGSHIYDYLQEINREFFPR